jgi:DNA repair protein RecN (Recombination protein N)
VIDEIDLELHPGLNVLTGETGAGKTMITVGLALALGRRAAASLVRAGAGSAKVQARFDATPAAVLAGWAEDGEVLLARTVGRDGRSTARIGGELAPVSALADVGSTLVETHGQHQDLRLLAGSVQTTFLDRFAGADHLALLERVAAAGARSREVRSTLSLMDREVRERDRELDLLRYQIREIESTAPRPGERAELEAEEARLSHIERLTELAAAATAALAGDDAGGDRLAAGVSALRSAAGLDPAVEGLASLAADLAGGVADLARDVRAYGERLRSDPRRLEEVHLRLAALRDLERKYGADEAEVLAYLERSRTRAEELEGSEGAREALAAELAGLEARFASLLGLLSEGRRAAAPRLAEAITGELRALGMQEARAEVSLAPFPEPGPSGAERAVLLFSGGEPQPLLPLSKVASGGELSRTMLACRSVMVDLDDVPTLVFDEVDAGIGGAAATAVGRRLARLGQERQVIVVTHLPQIASFADRHVRVTKHRGKATAEVLDDRGRVLELSRMLSGRPESVSASVHAEELLAEAARARARRPGTT